MELKANKMEEAGIKRKTSIIQSFYLDSVE